MAFDFDNKTWVINMHQGDTGSKWIHAERESGTAWTEDDRCLFTVTDASGRVVIQRAYRLDDQWDAGDGNFLMEFHNNDTDELPAGTYYTEWRFAVSPTWNGPVPEGRCANTMVNGEVVTRMTDGPIVRTKIQSTMMIKGVSGKI